MSQHCSKDKTHGPNCFNMGFVHKFYHVMKENILKLFKELHDAGTFMKSLNTSS